MSAKGVDALSDPEIEKRLARSLELLEEIKALWPDLGTLAEADRSKNKLGRVLVRLKPALGALLGVVTAKGAGASSLAKHFEALADKDEGYDPTRFEAELLMRRIHRIEAEQKLQDGLQVFARELGDDALSTGKKVVSSGKLAIDLARTLAQSNDKFYRLLSPMLDALAAMTKSARKAQAEQAKEAAGEPAANGASAHANGAAAKPANENAAAPAK